MGQVRHGSATTTQAVEQYSIARSLRRSAGRWASIQKTVAKWRKRATVEDMRTGPKEPRRPF